MIKVLYLLNHAGKAGTERYVQQLVERLHHKKIEAYLAYNETGLLVQKLEELGVQTFQIKMRHPLDLIAVCKLRQLVKKLGIDILHAQFLRENYLAMLTHFFYRKVKVVYTNHFILENSWILRQLNKWLSPQQGKIIAVCNKGKDMMIQNGADQQKIQVIFNGIDPEEWGQPIESTLRQELGITAEAFVILCASRFAYDKGHDFLIRGIEELAKQTNLNFQLVLAGDGPFVDSIQQMVNDMGLTSKVTFIGFRSDMKNLLAAANVYINASKHEALSFAILEVLASGLPLIATDMGGNGDIVNEHTQCGILVPYDDEKALSQAIQNVMNDPELQQKLSINAKKTVRAIFDIDQVVDKTYTIYNQV